MSEVRSLEHPTLKVPYEVLNKKFRIAQKTLDREVNHVQTASNDLQKNLSSKSAGEISRLLGGVVERLQVLKRKAEESINEELAAGFLCKRRVDHLMGHAPNAIHSSELAQATVNDWRRVRLDRILVEHFLRFGYHNTAEVLVEKAGLQDLTNIEIFKTSREVELDLSNHKTTKCSAWCNDNKSKLRKLNSSLEFRLRVQEFVELVRIDNRLEAVKHARKFFPQFKDDQLQEISHCMALLAFPEVEPYRSLMDPARWDDLKLQFRRENYRLFQLGSHSVLSVALQVGLSVLKTPQCYSVGSRNKRCPVCKAPFNELAANLPFAHCAQSKLICRASGEPLNEHNLPMMLPNGQVFGEKAIRQMAEENNGIIICPQTNQSFCMKRVEKVFVM